MRAATTAIIAVGRCDRGDGVAGLVVGDVLRRRGPRHATVIDVSTDGFNLLDVWKRHDRVFVVEVVRSGALPGVVHRIDPAVEDIPATFGLVLGNHDITCAVATARWRRSGRSSLIVYSIEGQRFTARAGVSPDVATAAHDVAERILAEV